MAAIKFDNLFEFKQLTKGRKSVDKIWIERSEFDIAPWDREIDKFNVVSYAAY